MKIIDIIKLIISILQMASDLKPAILQIVEFIKWCIGQFKTTEQNFPSREGAASLTPKNDALSKLTEIKKASFDNGVATKFISTFGVELTKPQIEAIRGTIDRAVNPKYKLRQWEGGKKP